MSRPQIATIHQINFWTTSSERDGENERVREWEGEGELEMQPVTGSQLTLGGNYIWAYVSYSLVSYIYMARWLDHLLVGR